MRRTSPTADLGGLRNALTTAAADPLTSRCNFMSGRIELTRHQQHGAGTFDGRSRLGVVSAWRFPISGVSNGAINHWKSFTEARVDQANAWPGLDPEAETNLH